MIRKTIREILGDRPLYSVTPETSLRDAAKLMAQKGVGAVVVTDGGKLVGILSERDIVFRAIARDLSMDATATAEIMTPEPVTVEIDDAISETMAAKIGEAFRHLPVTEHGEIVGLLSYRDIPAEYVMMYERFREISSSRADD